MRPLINIESQRGLHPELRWGRLSSGLEIGLHPGTVDSLT